MKIIIIVMSQIYFISGHLDLTEQEFEKYYVEKINFAISNECSFVIGDAKGADLLAQKYLTNCISNNLTFHDKVTIYHMFKKPRNNFGNFKTIGGFENDNDRDVQMTNDSTDDILWIRSKEEQLLKLGAKYDPNYVSGTQKNMIRRLSKKI